MCYRSGCVRVGVSECVTAVGVSGCVSVSAVGVSGCVSAVAVSVCRTYQVF